MRDRHLSRPFSVLILVAVLGAAGCASTRGFARILPPALVARHAPPGKQETTSTTTAFRGVVIQPGMELKWTVNSPSSEPGQVTTGIAPVGPDGTLVVGPYGTCAVGGMSLPQAERALAKHLAPYTKQARVTLRAAGPAAPAGPVEAASAVPQETIVWRTSSPSMDGGPNAPVSNMEPDDGLSGLPLTPADGTPQPIASTPPSSAVQPAGFCADGVAPSP